MYSMAAVSVDNGPTLYMNKSDTAVRCRQRVLMSEYNIVRSVWGVCVCAHVHAYECVT